MVLDGDGVDIHFAPSHPTWDMRCFSVASIGNI